jgi:hypothetical protein
MTETTPSPMGNVIGIDDERIEPPGPCRAFLYRSHGRSERANTRLDEFVLIPIFDPPRAGHCAPACRIVVRAIDGAHQQPTHRSHTLLFGG